MFFHHMCVSLSCCVCRSADGHIPGVFRFVFWFLVIQPVGLFPTPLPVFGFSQLGLLRHVLDSLAGFWIFGASGPQAECLSRRSGRGS